MSYSFDELLSFFFIYGFVGWISEVIFAAFKTGRFVNRGFLLGPICPIYGFGVVAVLCLLEPVRAYPLSVFVLSVLVTSAIELLVGIISEKLFHERLWDYSDCFMNIGGYVCLTFSLLWGVGCMAVFYGLHPLIAALVRKIPGVIEAILLSVFSAAILADTIITLTQALKIESRMKAIENAAKQLESISAHIGKSVSDGAIHIKEKAEESEKLRKQLNLLVNKRNIVHDHMFHAFERLKTGKYKEAYERLKAAKKQRGEKREKK